MKLLRLTYKNFKAQSQAIDLGGADVDVFGANGIGKTTTFDAFLWLLFGKDAKGAELSEDIKTKSLVDNGQEHEVEATLLLDNGNRIKLKRTFREMWTKKRGSATESFSGHTTDFFIDDVPKKKREYSDEISSIIDESRFKLLTDPLYFKNQLSWQDRRKILIEVCGDISDEEVVDSNPQLADLPVMLAGKSIEDYRKILQATRTKTNDELKKIPVRIDEAQRNLPDIDGLVEGAIMVEVGSFKKQQADLNRQIIKIQEGGAAAAKRQKLAEFNAKQIEIKTRYDQDVSKAVMAQQRKISELENKRSRSESSVEVLQKRIDSLQKAIEVEGNAIQKVRDDWYAESSKVFQDKITNICPTCGQTLPAEKVEAARQKALEAFNLAKSDALTAINAQGKAAKARLEEHGAELERLQDSITTEQEKVKAIGTEIESAKADQGEFADYTTDSEYLRIEAAKNNLANEVKALALGSDDEVHKIQAQIKSIDLDIESRQEKLAAINTNRAGKVRIAELKAQQKKLVVEFESLEHSLYLTELFIKTKVRMLDEKINSKFEIAQFRLFSDQVNGGLTECCDVLYDGVARMSNSQEIKVGLDIIRTLSKHYGISTPIFVDNCESITELPSMDGQVIRLIVSAEDKKLRIVRKDKNNEQAAA